MNNPINLLIKQMMSSPQITNTPMGQRFLEIVNSGNEQAGIEMANNILTNLGISREEALQRASSGIQNMFYGRR